MKSLFIILIIGSLTACGGFKVGVDEETLETIESVFNDSDSTGDESGGNSTGNSKAPKEKGKLFTDDGPDFDRVFLGTYEHNHVYDSCSDWPSVIRLYQADDIVYFDNSQGELITQAVIYQDDTFDFVAEYTDDFGRPNQELVCTCEFDDSQWYTDKIDCVCELEGDECHVVYDEME